MRPGEYYKYINPEDPEDKETYCIKLLEYAGQDIWYCEVIPYNGKAENYEQFYPGNYIYTRFQKVDRPK